MEELPSMSAVPLSEKQRTILKTRRLELGLRQADLASKIGKSTIYVRKLENGERQPTSDVIKAICAALNLAIQIKITVKLKGSNLVVNIA